MKTVGKQLQDARVAKGWSPELAARETKIRVDRLNELEADDYSNFSSPTYARGFVRTYARSLGLDEYKILRQLDNKLPEDDNASFVNDTGVPYMPEPSKVSKPFEVGRGVYIAAGIGTAVLLLIGFILVQTYRAGYFAQALPATMPNAATNSAPLVPDSESTTRALPADSNAPPVALPVDATAIAAASADTNTAPTVAAPAAPVATAPTDTNAAPRALPVDLTALAASGNVTPAAPVASAVAPAAVALPPAATTAAPAANANAVAESPTSVLTPGATVTIASPTANNVPVVAETAAAPTTPLNTTTSPRAQAVDLNALATAPPAGDAGVAATPVPQPTPHASPALSARQSNARSQTPVIAINKSPSMPVAVPVATPVAAAPVNMPIAASVAPAQEFRPSPDIAAAQPPPADAAPTPASFTPAAAPENRVTPTTVIRAAPDSTSAFTGGDSMAASEVALKSRTEKSYGKRLVLTASRDSFVRVVALDGPHGNQVRYSSMLHSGESISFSDRKYTINVGDPAAVDIALDGINYGPHSDHSEPDTFTVESHQP